MSSKSIVRKHLNFIVNSVLETFGRTNVLSIILLGSWARGSGAYRIVNHKPIVESDYDIIVVKIRRVTLRHYGSPKHLRDILHQIFRKGAYRLMYLFSRPPSPC